MASRQTTDLHRKIQEHDWMAVKHYVNTHPEWMSHQEEEFGAIPLLHALKYTAPEDVVLFIANATPKSVFDLQNNDGWTALMYASTEGNTDVVNLLIDSGAAVDLTNNIGWTALMYASTTGHTDVVQLLIGSDAAVDLTDNDGRSAMHIAANEGHASIIERLLLTSGNVLLTKNEQNPLHQCFANPCLAFEEYLRVSVVLLKHDRKMAFAKDKENRSPIAMYVDHTLWKYQDTYTAQREKEELLKILNGGPLPLIELDETHRVTNQELVSISMKLYGNWRKFGEYFGFQTEDLNLIDRQYGHDVGNCIRMLTIWMSWKKDSDGFMETINALKECDAMEIPVEILARGPEAWKLFQVAIEDGDIKVNMTPIRIIGQENSGKTCLMNSLLGKKFNKEHIITDAIATTTFSCINKKENKNEWAQYEGEHDDRFEDVVANKIVEQFNQKKSPLTDEFSIPSKKRLKLDPQPKSTKEGPNESPEVTTTANLAKSSTLLQGAQQLLPTAKSNGFKYTKGMVLKVESALKGRARVLTPDEDIMKIWDYGGQPIYHSIQRLYIRPLGIYITTFKLTDDLDAFTQIEDSSGNLHRYHMTNLEHLLYWISSPYNYCSVSERDAELELDLPVSIVVGTHLDSLVGSEEEKKAKVKQIFDKIRKAIKDKPYESHVYPTFFDVENQLSSSDENICKLKEVILKIMDKMKKKIPIKWLHFLIAILKIGKETLILPLKEVKLKAQECGITDDKTIELAIKFFSDVGEISYHPTEEALRDIVVLKPMDLVEYVKTVFTVKMPEHLPAILQKEWRDLEKGILRKSLLKHLWQKFPIFADDKDEKMFNFFVNLMKKFGLICQVNTTSGSGDQVFYAFPHLQPVIAPVSLKCDERDGNDKVSIFHDFCGFLPDHLFQLACTRLIEQVQVEQPSELKLEYNHIEMNFDECHLVNLSVATIKHRRMFKTTIMRRQMEGATDVAEPKRETCKKVLALLNGVLEYLHLISRRGIQYKMCVPCSDNFEHMHIVDNFNTDVVSCGRVLKSIARYCRLFGDSTATHTIQCSLDDKALLRICNELDNNWRSLGINLGISLAEIERIVDDNRQVNDAIMAMLVKWRNQQSSDANQISVMSDALKQAGYVHIATRLINTPTGHSDALHDNDLLSISEGLGTNWKRFGVSLGEIWQSLQLLESQHRGCVQDACMSMLTTWRKRQSIETNQVDVMIRLLDKQGFSAVADRLRRDMDSEDALHDNDLLSICDGLGTNWKRFGVSLGFNWQHMRRLESEFRGSVEDACMSMLTTWTKQQSIETNQVDVMIRLLDEQGFSAVADLLRQDMDSEDALHDNDLLSICDGLGTNWKRFGVSLGFNWQHMRRLESQHRGCVEDACMSMLTTWRKQQSIETNQVDVMTRLLDGQGISTFADRFRRDKDSEDALHDNDMLSICDGLGTNWKRFGVSLGFNWQHIRRLESQHRDCVEDACMSMLTMWRERQSIEINQLDVMIRLLDEHGFSEVADLLRRDMDSEGALRDNDMLSICDGLGTNWKRFGVSLGFNWQHIRRFESQHRGCVEDACMSMLTTWRKQQSIETNQVDVMVRLLDGQGFSAVADLLRQDMDSEGALRDNDMLSICDGLGTNWKRFGVSLGFNWQHMRRLESQHQGCVEDACMSMLTTWRERQSIETNQVDVMIRLLDEQGFSVVADRLRRDMDSEGQLDDKDFLYISGHTYIQWKQLAVCLGFKWTEVQSIASECQGLDASMKMLTRWRTRQLRDVNQLDVMCQKLIENDFTEIADQLKAKHVL